MPFIKKAPSGGRSLRRVCRDYPLFRSHFRLSARAEASAQNKHLKKKDASAMTLFLTDLLKAAFGRGEPAPAPETAAKRFFAKNRLSDRLLFLFEDACGMALLLFLCGERKGEKKEEALAFAAKAAERLDDADFKKLYLSLSRVNGILTKRRFLCYPQCDAESRAFIRRSVYAYAKKHRISDENAAKLIGDDYFRQRQTRLKRAYMTLFALCPLPLLAIAVLLCGTFEAFLLILPLLALSEEITRAAASLFVDPSPILKLKSGPIADKIVVVLTVLLTNEQDIGRFSRALEKMYLQNSEENVVFGLLADLKDAPFQSLPEDGALKKKTADAISALNKKYGEKFCLFLRKRSYSPTEKTYMGWERKRGALIELNRLLKHGTDNFETAILPAAYKGRTSYLLTLDADTELRIGAVGRMYAAMKHPANKPVIDGGVVASGFGVIQPRMASSIESAGKTPFSTLFSGGAGTDSYQHAVFDFYESVFGKGAFCGKGMIDVNAFDAVIDGAFPDGRILSHDLLEGTRLRCGYMSELTLTDSCPSTVLSYLKRQHRWIRGDLQAFPFALRRLPFEKEKKPNPIDGVSRFMLFSNAVRAVVPIVSLICLILSGILGEKNCAFFLLFSFGYLIFPLLTSVVRTAKFVGRRFYSKVMQNVWQAVCRTLFSLASLCRSAVLSFDALVRVVFRSLVSKKKLLEWVTASETEKKSANGKKRSALLSCIKDALPSFPAAILLLVLSGGGVVRLLSLLFLIFPFVSFLLSLPYKKTKKLKRSGEETLKEYAAQSFAYFEKFVTSADHDLPPDNYEEHPEDVVAHRTSPTNIALYLLSVCAMKDLGKLTEKDMIKKLEKTLDTLIRLPKFRGHLYNWYDTRSLDILGQPYISTVDSGNLVLALTALKSALDETGDDGAALSSLVGALIADTDFSFLFNEKKGLLCIGYDPVEQKQSANCYDLLASEARSAYYFAIAKRQIPYESWAKAGRPVTARDGHIGLLSWSGTAFEFFMPALFLPVYENTLLYEALCFALFEQARDRTCNLWGRSESCYFAFDNEMNYQYKAFGCAALAIDPSVSREDVIAPYASFLALCLSPDLALNNLRRLREAGASGTYGFYEAIDFTKARVGQGSAVIRCYMSHHIGMSIVACANALCGDVFVQRVLRDPTLDAATELLTESVPCDAPVSSLKWKKAPSPVKLQSFFQKPSFPERRSPGAALLAKGALHAIASDKGFVSLHDGARLITPPLLPEKTPKHALSVRFFDQSGPIDLLKQKTHFYFDGRQIVYALQNKSAAVYLSILLFESRGFVLHVECSAPRRKTLCISSPLPLCTVGEHRSHPAFRGLSVECSYLEDEKILLFRKRALSEKQPAYFCAVCFSDEEKFEFLSSFDDYPVEAEELAFVPFFRRTGPVRKPYFAVRREMPEDGKCDLLIFCGGDRGAVLSDVSRARAIHRRETLCRSIYKENRLLQKKRPEGVFPDRAASEYVSLLLEGCARFRGRDYLLPEIGQGELWRHGVSGDDPIFTFLLPDAPLADSQKKIISGLCRAHACLCFGGVPCDLVFIKKESDLYFSPLKKEFEKLLAETTGGVRPGKRSGVHLLTDREAANALPSFSRVCMLIDRDCIFESFKKQFLSCLQTEKEPPLERCFPKEAERVFFDGDAVVIKNKNERPPFSQIYCGRQFGTLLTHHSLGFSWMCSASEMRLTPFSGDEIEGFEGEKLILETRAGRFDLCSFAEETRFEQGNAVYTGACGGISFSLYVGVDFKFPVKMLVLKLRNSGNDALKGVVSYEILPVLGSLPDGNVCAVRQNGAVFFKRSVKKHDLSGSLRAYVSPESAPFSIRPGEEQTLLFLMGCSLSASDRCFYAAKERFDTPRKAFEAFEKCADFYREKASVFTVKTDHPSFDLFFDRFLTRQVYAARLFGRTGFYQPGGAYGFRDQLQDALCLCPIDKNALKIQLFRAAAHQFSEGDVQHWWHVTTVSKDRGDWGVRTRCSDDLLFLPYAAVVYLRETGDASILDKQIGYLDAPPLTSEEDRFERPAKGKRKESLYFHCLRAIERAEARRSARGLLLIGSCDWNDGLSSVRGESVWLTQFFALVLKGFLPFAHENDRKHLKALLEETLSALSFCYEHGRYLRAFFKDGSPMGKEGNGYCAIDLLPQAFSVFLHPDEKSRAAIRLAYERLFLKDPGIFLLFSPAYEGGDPFPGYLGGYCPGFRENGGQYTHAAVWGASALLRAGEHEKGWEVLNALNPSERSARRPGYALEPYAMAGDVYSAKGYEGRGGWSLYTGSAGWFWRTALTDLLGYEEQNGCFSLHPRLCPSFSGFVLEIRKIGSFFRVEAEAGDRPALLLDGKAHENLFSFDGGSHILKIVLQKTKEWCKIEADQNKMPKEKRSE